MSGKNKNASRKEKSEKLVSKIEAKLKIGIQSNILGSAYEEIETTRIEVGAFKFLLKGEKNQAFNRNNMKCDKHIITEKSTWRHFKYLKKR